MRPPLKRSGSQLSTSLFVAHLPCVPVDAELVAEVEEQLSLEGVEVADGVLPHGAHLGVADPEVLQGQGLQALGAEVRGETGDLAVLESRRDLRIEGEGLAGDSG